MTDAAAISKTTISPPSRFAATLWLTVACLCWGWSFCAMPMATQVLMPRAGEGAWSLLAVVATFIAWRFWLAAVLYAGLNWRALNSFTCADLLGGLAVGLTFAGGIFLQMLGLRYALPSASGFITSMPVVLLPLIQAFWLKRPLRPVSLWVVAIGLSLVGLACFGFSAAPAQAVPPFRFYGELLTLCGTFFFTAQILSVDHFGARADPIKLTLLMFVTTALVATAVSLAVPGGAALWGASGLAALRQERELQVALVSMVIFSSVLAFHLMNRFQPRLTPTMAGIIYCLEPVFATMWSLGLGMEQMRLNLACGGTCILLALILASCTPPTAANTRQRRES